MRVRKDSLFDIRNLSKRSREAMFHFKDIWCRPGVKLVSIRWRIGVRLVSMRCRHGVELVKDWCRHGEDLVSIWCTRLRLRLKKHEYVWSLGRHGGSGGEGNQLPQKFNTRFPHLWKSKDLNSLLRRGSKMEWKV
jgi:hypothetical protein